MEWQPPGCKVKSCPKLKRGKFCDDQRQDERCPLTDLEIMEIERSAEKRAATFASGRRRRVTDV